MAAKKKTAKVKAKKATPAKKKVAVKKAAKKTVTKATKTVAKKVAKKPAAKKPAAKKPVAKKPAAKAKKAVAKAPVKASAKKVVAKKAAGKKPAKKATAPRAQVVEILETEAPTQLQLVAFDETEVMEVDTGDEDGSNEEELAEAREVFQKFDKDQNGYIDAGEFANMLEALGVEPTEEEVQAGLAAVDSNNSGRISWNEFATYWLSE